MCSHETWEVMKSKLKSHAFHKIHQFNGFREVYHSIACKNVGINSARQVHFPRI